LSDDKLKADAFNDFFTGIGTKISNSIPQGSKTHKDYLINNTVITVFEFDEIGPIYVIDIIKSLPSKSSSDLNGISSKLIKHIKVEIAVPLSHIFTQSLKNGVFPEALKCSRTVPIYKSGDKALCDNYRPISLVPTFSKLLEKIVATKLYNYLDLNSILYDHQYGFQQKKSTEHSILQLVNYVSTALNDNKYCVGIFLDIKKAFDCVDHNILFHKLDKLGIKNNKLNWFKSYLNNRSQRVDINGTISESKTISIGVLQGSSLGPLLFLCFINDMPRSSLFFSLLFADDTACLASHPDINTLYNMVNLELQKIACWFKANKLAVNVSKTKYIHFHYKQKKVDLTNYKVYYNDNDPENAQDQSRIFELSRIYNTNPNPDDRYYKYLGILVDESLTFDTHLSYISTKLCRSLYILNRAKNTLPKSTLKNVYFALIHPHLLYCTSITACTTKKNIDKL